VDFKEIEKELYRKTAELEVAKARELKSVTERLALLNQKEEARQKEVRDAQRAATAAAIRRRLEQQLVEEQLLRETTEKRVLEEQIYSKKQSEIEVDVRTTQQLAQDVAEQQHIEEMVRKSLDNAKYSVRKTIGTDGEVIMPNPMARFLQKEPE
jgi:hypothetical protein